MAPAQSSSLQCGPAQLGREMRRGSGGSGAARRLQCGPAQLGREMHCLGEIYGARVMLQCGPAQLGREIGAEDPSATAAICFNAARPNWAGKSSRGTHETHPPPASMRPGPIGPGNFRLATLLERESGASMRPGPIGPGNINLIMLAFGIVMLQCGPAQLGREIW